MKLLTLRLANFRQFYGDSPPIRFAHGARNVTGIIGNNGAGKTSLLNAFTWLLYDSTTPAFQLPHEIVNKRAIFESRVGDTSEAWVELEFEHNEAKYLVRRAASAVRINQEPGYTVSPPSSATLHIAGPDGEWRQRDDVEDAIGLVLPRALHSFFFFDGERIERIVSPTSEDRNQTASATKVLIGVELLDRAVRHLSRARAQLEKEYRKIGDPETQELLLRKSQAEERIEEIGEETTRCNSNLNGWLSKKAHAQSRLREVKEVADKQRKRDELEQQAEALNTSLDGGRSQLLALVSTDAYQVFLPGICQKFRDLIDALRERGELPSGIKRQFVDDLLKTGVCICDRPLAEHDVATEAVEKWMERAGLADVEEAALRMGGEVRGLLDGVPRFDARLAEIQALRTKDRALLSKTETELEKISAELRNSPREEVAGLERAFEEARERARDCDKDILRLSFEKEGLDKDVREIDRVLDSHLATQQKQRLAQRRVQATRDAVERLSAYRDNLEAEFRRELEKRIQDLFGEISFKPYVPQLSQEYFLRLVESTQGMTVPVGASTGECQILSLSFIGSVISLARDYQSRREHLSGPDSSQYPIVMDSPFGSLDPTYRRQIAEHIPKLANQLVVMVSKTQWRHEVEESFDSTAGRLYVITYYSTKEDPALDSVELGGRSFSLVKKSPGEFEYSEITEVSRG